MFSPYCYYPASRDFSLAWLLVLTKSFAWLVCCVVSLFTPREKPLQQAAWDFRWACARLIIRTAVVGPLTSLFMQSIRECRVYNNWKVARLTPVFKKDDPTVISNYRTLSLLSVPSKILESCVADMIAKHVFSENEALVTDNQWA